MEGGIDELQEEIDELSRQTKRYADEEQELARLDPGVYKKWRQVLDEIEVTAPETPQSSTWTR